jgi:hypothetical protein
MRTSAPLSNSVLTIEFRGGDTQPSLRADHRAFSDCYCQLISEWADATTPVVAEENSGETWGADNGRGAVVS